MNRSLVFLLSLLGLVMGLLTVFIIPGDAEPYFWLSGFIVTAVIVALKGKDKYFLSGFYIGLVNSIWNTLVHLILFRSYQAHHNLEVRMMDRLTMLVGFKGVMLIMCPVIGLLSGIVIGSLSILASIILRKRKEQVV